MTEVAGEMLIQLTQVSKNPLLPFPVLSQQCLHDIVAALAILFKACSRSSHM